MFTYLANALVIAGAGILVCTLFPLCRLTAQLPPGALRRKWCVLAALILVFIVGYAGYGAVFWSRHLDWPDLIVPAMFFLGACFACLVSTLSLQTTVDVRRLALLERESITDSLIGIYNRRHLERRLEEEFARAQRYALALSVLLVDIDHFKRINDTYGHQAGDQVLSGLGRLVLGTVRAADVAARYGGEELLIIAPETPLPAAVALAQRLRQGVAAHGFGLAGERREEIRITVSIGVAERGPGIDSAQKLVRNADEALYRAKREGRNRVIVGGQAPAPTDPHGAGVYGGPGAAGCG